MESGFFWGFLCGGETCRLILSHPVFMDKRTTREASDGSA